MRGEIIAIGNELISGRISNTTSGFAARHLFAAGYEIHAMHTIGDSPTMIGEALKRAISRVDFVLVTGGLGSTDDDLTTEAVSQALDLPTVPNLELLSQIRNHLDSISASPMNPLEKLAWLPQGRGPDPSVKDVWLSTDSRQQTDLLSARGPIPDADATHRAGPSQACSVEPWPTSCDMAAAVQDLWHGRGRGQLANKCSGFSQRSPHRLLSGFSGSAFERYRPNVYGIWS